jgi:Cd2+/Zn2+-exporting ATPase
MQELELPIHDPGHAPESDGACPICARDRLEGRLGVLAVEPVAERPGTPAGVRVRFDESVVSRDELLALARCPDPTHAAASPEAPPPGASAGPAPRVVALPTLGGQTLSHCIVLPVHGMASDGAARRVERVLNRLGKVQASASHAAGVVRIRYEPEHCSLPEVATRLRRLGLRPEFDAARVCDGGPLPASAPPRPNAVVRAGAWLAGHPQIGIVLLGGLLLVNGWLVFLLDGPLWLRLLLLAASAVCTSTETFPEAISALRQRRLDVDVLMFVAAGGAAALGHYEEGAFLLFLFGLGAAGEHLALSRARRSIRALTEVAPDTATILDEAGHESTVPVAEAVVGARAVVRPFDRVPLDGRIDTGRSALNEAPITGESVPVDKAPGDEVFAGSINGEGRLEIVITRPAGETTLARVIRLVEEAQASKSPTQLFTDRIEAVYVPIVFVATLLLIALPPLLSELSWGTAFYRAMAFLTAASPCALAIGTPAAILCGVARSAQMGVLVKGGAYLEALGRSDAIAFDKTGTLTRGEPAVVRVVPAPGLDEDRVLALAAAIEGQVNHPLADAIVDAARERGLAVPEPVGVRQISGSGAEGTVDGVRLAITKPAGVGEGVATDDAVRAAIDGAIAEGITVAVIADGSRVLGFIGIADRIRDESPRVIRAIHALGVKRVTMLTGDHAAAARAIAERVGLDDWRAGLLPEEKLAAIDGLSAEHGRVAMVGDGVNDAPALARADIGIAMGAAGADVAMETADIVLMGSDLDHLPQAIGLSRFARRIITQNLVIALGVIAVVAPLGALGFATLALAVLLHEGSTVVVVLNSLRLLGYERSGRDAG